MIALLACCCAVIGFGVVAYFLDGGDLRAVLARVLRRGAGNVTASRIGYVLGTTAGGTGRHVAMLAEG